MTLPRTVPTSKPNSRNLKVLEKPTPPRKVTITVPERTAHVERDE